jgi:hypothetical protein
LLLAEHAEQAVALLETAETGKRGHVTGMDLADLLSEKGKALLRLNRFHEAERTFQGLVDLHTASLSASKAGTARDGVIQRYEAAWRGLIEAQIRQNAPAAATLASWMRYRAGFDGANFDVRHLSRGSALISYAFLAGGLSAWFAGIDGVEQRWIPDSSLPGASLNEMARRLTGFAADPAIPQTVISELAREVEPALLGPFKHRLAQSNGDALTLHIDADGALQEIPWMILENETGKSLIERFPLVRVMGHLSEATRDRAQTFSSSMKVLVIADPVLNQGAQQDMQENFPPLQDALAEGVRVAKQFGPAAVMLQGKDATVAAFKAHASDVDLLHFAGHGVRNGGYGGLLLAGQPRLLTAAEISGLRLSGLRLAVLSSCSSGFTEESAGADGDLLVKAFLDAGAARVLASSWPAESLATSQLMDAFYKQLMSGKFPAGALREAVLDLRSHSSGAHPSAWAAFELYGRN